LAGFEVSIIGRFSDVHRGPGSLIASFLPLHALWFPYLWTRFETDATGLATVLFLPTTVLINVIFFLIARYYFRRRAALRAG
jgi:hypothetical protein